DAAFPLAVHGPLVAHLEATAAGGGDPVELGLDPAAGGADAASVGSGVAEGVTGSERDELGDVGLNALRRGSRDDLEDPRVDGGWWSRSLLRLAGRLASLLGAEGSGREDDHTDEVRDAARAKGHWGMEGAGQARRCRRPKS